MLSSYFLKINEEDASSGFNTPLSMIAPAPRLSRFTIGTQSNSIDFINYAVNKFVVDQFPFRIKMIRTDNAHEFQTKFRWHVADLGLLQVDIKPATPRLNSKVERSQLTDQREFYLVLE